MPKKKTDNEGTPVAAEVVAEPVKEEARSVGTVDVQRKTITIDRPSESGFPLAKKWPIVRGGMCDFCGIDYTKCEHYQGLPLRCSYCPPMTEADLKDSITHRILQIFEYPIGSGNLVSVCDDMSCVTKHRNRFNQSRTV